MLDNNGCVTYTAGSVAGNESPICVIACDATTGFCDTTTIIITVTCTPKAITNYATSCNPADTGTVVTVLTGANGCDSTVTTITTLAPYSSSTVNATTCDPAQVGTVVDTIIGGSANGCDSIVTTITTLLPSDSITVNATTCDPAQAGTTVQTLTNQYGCDSVVTTITTLLPSASTTVNATSCNPADTGTVVTVLTGANGCDSIVTTITTLLPSDSITVNATTCDPAQAGTTVQTLTNQYGCDSVVTTITTLLPSASTTVNATSCNPADTGTVVTVLTGANGCDSIVTTITTLLPGTDTLIVDRITLCKGGSVTVGGQVFTEEGIYTIVIPNTNGCDSTITLDLSARICDSIGVVLTDTIRDTNFVNTIDTLCLTPLSGQIDNVTIISCGYSNNSGNVYTVVNGSCIEIVRSEEVGYNIDTLCVVACNSIGDICDTTTIIISNTPSPCEDILQDTAVTVSCNGAGQGEYCLPLTLTTIRDYDLYVDGTLTALQLSSESGCGTEIVTAGYGFQTIGYMDNVAHLLEVWSIDSVRTVYPNINFQTLEELAEYMNTVDTTGEWYVDGLNVRPGNATDLYRTGSGIEYFALEPEVRTNYIPYSYNVGYSGTKLLLDTGCHVVKLVNKQTGCTDSVTVCVESCPAQVVYDTLPIRTTDTLCVFTTGAPGETVAACDGATAGTTALGSWTIDEQGCLIYEAGPVKGNDTLCITTCNGAVCTETTVIITVTGLPPVAVNDTTATEVNTPVTIPVLGNDIQTDEDPLSLCAESAIVTNPQHGSVVVNNDGTITYIPVTGYTGVDSFQYQICDPEGKDTAWVFITINGECQLPTVITPNGDGFNETFEVPCASGSPISFYVYNRWGIEVYRSEDYANDFDGRYKGAPLPDGTYYYIVKYVNAIGEEVNKSSYLTIRR
ncbi:MAG: gliding motility-associated C-terminal domain-containing protein [Acinetobacter sp.]|nr:MAG: gliding motility-associated C-terminal domain-containing protein [Acinetobacter sp.]